MRKIVVGVAAAAAFVAVGAQPASAQLEPVVDVLGVADTGIGMNDNPGQVKVGEEFTYRLNVRNVGPSDARDVRVQTRLADSLEFVDVTVDVLDTDPEQSEPPTPVDCTTPPANARVVTCRIDTLQGGVLTDEGSLFAQGQRARVFVTVVPTQQGRPTSRASVESSNVDLNRGNNNAQEGTRVSKP